MFQHQNAPMPQQQPVAAPMTMQQQPAPAPMPAQQNFANFAAAPPPAPMPVQQQPAPAPAPMSQMPAEQQPLLVGAPIAVTMQNGGMQLEDVTQGPPPTLQELGTQVINIPMP